MFFLEYIECKPTIDNCYGQYGTFCHELLEQCANGKLEVYELTDKYIEGFDAAVKEPFPNNNYVDLREKYYNQGYDYFESFEGFDDYEILAVEKRVEFVLADKYKFVGVIDLVVRDSNGEILIIDHKSKTIFKRMFQCLTCGKRYTAETADKRGYICTKKCQGKLDEDKTESKEFMRQLYLYSIAIFNEYGEYPKRLAFNFFRDRQTFYVEFDTNDLEEAIQWVVDAIENISRDNVFVPRKSDYFCQNICGARHYCTDSDRYLGV
jgi:CRISPR/Cas system-associated exonuclease Cas4 (RecB family)